MKFLLPLIPLALFLASCATSPVYTDKHGHMHIDTSSSRQSPSMIATGEKIFNEYKKNKKVVYNSQVARVGNRLKKVAPLPGVNWEIVTFQNSVPNAFALPGGKVGIHTGILPLAKTDGGLATIIAHEIAHVTKNHHEQRQKRQAVVGGLGALANAALGGGYRQLIGTTSQLAVNLPNSRTNEIEADQVGLIYMARAGYNPNEAIAFWQRFEQYKKSKGQQSSPLFSTHPHDSTRIARLKQVLPLAMKEYKPR